MTLGDVAVSKLVYSRLVAIYDVTFLSLYGTYSDSIVGQRPLDCAINRLSCRICLPPYKGRRVLMIFEDAHCIDPTSLELFGRVVERIQALRALLIVTLRPEVSVKKVRHLSWNVVRLRWRQY
jgi:hypothetical protein